MRKIVASTLIRRRMLFDLPPEPVNPGTSAVSRFFLSGYLSETFSASWRVSEG